MKLLLGAIAAASVITEASGDDSLRGGNAVVVNDVVSLESDAMADLGNAASLKAGDAVCLTGYIMDNFCINRGTLLDDRSVQTLQNPEKHSFHCLLDVKPCYDSGFQVLGPKDPDTGMHCPGFRIDDTQAILAAGKAVGRKGYCTECTDADESKPTHGYAATIKGTVKEAGDGTDDPVSGTPVLTDVVVLDEGAGCDGEPTVPPLCVKAAPAPAAPLSCPDDLSDSFEIDEKATLHYAVVPSDPAGADNGILCGRLEVENDGWIGFAVSEAGKMAGSEAIIGIPAEGTIKKYDLTSTATLMSDDKQTLTGCSISQDGATTTMSFTKLLVEEGEIPILASGENHFLQARGGDALGYHTNGRIPFTLDFMTGPAPVPFTPLGPPAPAPAPEPEPAPEAPAEPAGPAKDCTKEFCENQLTDGYVLQYKINVPDSTTADVCEGCTISMELTYDSEAWISIAFSSTGTMIGSEAVIGLPDDGTVKKYNLASQAFDASGITPLPQQTLTDTSIVVADGKTVMKFTKIMKEDGEIEITTGDNKFLWAFGSGNALGYHDGRAPFELNLSSGASEVLAVPNKAAWLAHGIMAFLAWGVLVPFAVNSSLLRDLLPKGPLWFKLHRGFNSTAFALFIALFGIAVAFTSKEGASHFQNSHQKMGLAMFIMATFQVAGGVFRPHVPEEGQAKSAVRFSWEIGHRVLGVTLLACGFWQMREGIALFSNKYSVSEGGEGGLAIAYWVWIGIMTALIVLGGGYFKLKSRQVAVKN